MADFQTDVTKLTQEVATEAALVGQISDLVLAQNKNIADLQQQIAALKAGGVDTTGLESAIVQLDQNNAKLSGVLAPAPTPTPGS